MLWRKIPGLRPRRDDAARGDGRHDAALPGVVAHRVGCFEEQFGSRPGQCRPPDERLYGQIARGVYGRRGILHGTASFFDYNDGYFTPHQALTIVEFNLFGDPFLHVGVRRRGRRRIPGAVKALAKGAVNAVVERKCVYEAAPASLLDGCAAPSTATCR